MESGNRPQNIIWKLNRILSLPKGLNEMNIYRSPLRSNVFPRNNGYVICSDHFSIYKYSPDWQKSPVQYRVQLHLKALIWSIQVPLFWHGPLEHSSISEIKNKQGNIKVYQCKALNRYLNNEDDNQN